MFKRQLSDEERRREREAAERDKETTAFLKRADKAAPRGTSISKKRTKPLNDATNALPDALTPEEAAIESDRVVTLPEEIDRETYEKWLPGWIRQVQASKRAGWREHKLMGDAPLSPTTLLHFGSAEAEWTSLLRQYNLPRSDTDLKRDIIDIYRTAQLIEMWASLRGEIIGFDDEGRIALDRHTPDREKVVPVSPSLWLKMAVYLHLASLRTDRDLKAARRPAKRRKAGLLRRHRAWVLADWVGCLRRAVQAAQAKTTDKTLYRLVSQLYSRCTRDTVAPNTVKNYYEQHRTDLRERYGTLADDLL